MVIYQRMQSHAPGVSSAIALRRKGRSERVGIYAQTYKSGYPYTLHIEVVGFLETPQWKKYPSFNEVQPTAVRDLQSGAEAAGCWHTTPLSGAVAVAQW